MAKQFAVLHIEKGSGNATRLGSHIERKFNPSNADPQKRDLNKDIVTGSNNLNQDIDNRIEQSGAKVRKNSVKHLNIVLTGSHEKMKEIEGDPKRLQRWIDDNYRFLKEKYGKKNIMRLSLHRDERTPHLHAVVTPITKDGRLSAKQIVGNKNDLQRLQDDYAKRMEQHELSRGVKGSRATHDSIQEYYARIQNPVQANVNIPRKKTFESREAYERRVKQAIEPIIYESKHNRQKVQQWAGQAEMNQMEKNRLEQKARQLKKREQNIEQEKNTAAKQAASKVRKQAEQEKREVKEETYRSVINIVNRLLGKEGYKTRFESLEKESKVRIHSADEAKEEKKEISQLKEQLKAKDQEILNAKYESYGKAIEMANKLLQSKNINYRIKHDQKNKTVSLVPTPSRNKNRGMEM